MSDTKTPPQIRRSLIAYDAAMHDLAFVGLLDPNVRQDVEDLAATRRAQLEGCINRAIAKGKTNA